MHGCAVVDASELRWRAGGLGRSPASVRTACDVMCKHSLSQFRKNDLDPYAENNKSKSFYYLVHCHQSTANGYVRRIFPDYQSEQVYLALAQSLIL